MGALVLLCVIAKQSNNMPSRGDSKVKSCVIVFSSIFLTLQILAFIGTIVFYLFASSFQYRDKVADIFINYLYPQVQRKWLKRERALEFHIIIAGAIELALLLPTISLVIGASKRIRCLMLPFFGDNWPIPTLNYGLYFGLCGLSALRGQIIGHSRNSRGGLYYISLVVC